MLWNTCVKTYSHIGQFVNTLSLYCGYFIYYIHVYYEPLIVNKACI